MTALAGCGGGGDGGSDGTTTTAGGNETTTTTTTGTTTTTTNGTTTTTNRTTTNQTTTNQTTTNNSTGNQTTTTTPAGAQASYYLRQGNTCIPLRPLTGQKSAKDFYNYSAPFTKPSTFAYGSVGTEELQQKNTSILFLYQGRGRTSLIMVHGKVDAKADGGSATFVFDGLPLSGHWSVRDDSYTGEQRFDQWKRSGHSSQVDWTWGAEKSDGGVFTGIGDDPQITIKPAFNEKADLYGEHYRGRVTEWQALSATDGGGPPARTTLDMSKPVAILGSCG